MKKLNFYCLLSMLIVGSLSAISAADWSSIAVPANAGSGMTWELQDNVSDDFNYTFNAATTKTNFGSNKWYNFYHNAWDGPGTTYWKYNNVAVNGSDLVITVSKGTETTKMNGLKAINSGCVTSNNKVVYPVFVEAAVSVANISLASCFWLLSPDDTQEIDIIENYGNVAWFKQFTHISHHSFVRNPFTDYQPKDWNSWFTDSRVSGTYGWGDWNAGNGRRYMRMGVNWISPKHFEYYIDGAIVRVLYNNAIATKVGSTWEYTYFNSTYKDGNGYTFPSDNSSGYTDVTKYTTSTSYDFTKLEAANNASKGFNVIDPGWFQGGTTTATGFTKAMDIIINVESQSWLATSHTPSDADLANSARNQMKVDWVRVYKPVASSATVAVTGVTVSPATLSLAVGATGTITGAVMPTNATVKTMTFTSSNTAVATVNQSGVVTAVNAGTATITATTTDGSKKATSAVTVTAATTSTTIVIEAESFTTTGGTYNDGFVPLGVNKTASTINYVNTGDYANYTINVATAGEYQIEYQISSPSANAQIQFTADGTLISTDNVVNNGAWDSYQSLVASKKVNLTAGSHTIQIKASGTNAWQWNLNNITLTRTGNIVSTTIAVTGLTIDKTTLALEVGAKGVITGAVVPTTATDKTMTFTSAKTSVATVNQSGVVTAVSAGTAVITLKTTDGGFTKTCTVTVTALPTASVIVIQAEDFTGTGGTYNDGFVTLGVNKVAGLGINYVNTGDWASYNVTIPSDGAYEIVYSISSPITGSTIAFKVNDVLFNTTTVPNNGAWDSYQNLTAVSTANFTAGNHVVKVQAGATNWCWNLDKITLTRTGALKNGKYSGSKTEFSLFPNPVQDVLNIQLGQDLNADASYVIYNTTGNMIMSGSLTADVQTIELNQLPSGLYLIYVKNGSELSVKKFIKQ